MTISTGALLGGAAIAAAGSALSGYLNNRFQRKFYDRQVADARKNWQTENAYNSPAAQMARFKAAGLNPNLIYQNGADAASGALDTPTPGGNGSFDNFLGSGVDAYSSMNQVNQVAAYTDYLKSLKVKTDNEASGIHYDNIFKAAKSEFAPAWAKREFENLGYNGAVMQAKVENLKQHTKLLYEQTGITEQEKDTFSARFAMDMYTARVKNLLSEKSILEIDQRIKNMQQDINESKQRVNESKAQVSVMAQIWNNYQVQIARAKIAKTIEEAEANWSLKYNSKDWLDSGGTVFRSNLEHVLQLELDKLEKDYKYMTWDRVNDTFRSVGTSVGAGLGAYLMRGKKSGPIGFKTSYNSK